MGNKFTNFYFGLNVSDVKDKINKNKLHELTDTEIERIVYHYKIEDISLLLNTYNINYIKIVQYKCKKIYEKRKMKKYSEFWKIVTNCPEFSYRINNRLLLR